MTGKIKKLLLKPITKDADKYNPLFIEFITKTNLKIYKDKFYPDKTEYEIYDTQPSQKFFLQKMTVNLINKYFNEKKEIKKFDDGGKIELFISLLHYHSKSNSKWITEDKALLDDIFELLLLKNLTSLSPMQTEKFKMFDKNVEQDLKKINKVVLQKINEDGYYKKMSDYIYTLTVNNERNRSMLKGINDYIEPLKEKEESKKGGFFNRLKNRVGL